MDSVYALRDFFSQRHISLSNEWETEVIRFVKLQSTRVRDSGNEFSLARVIYDQWLFSDLAISTLPSLKIPPVHRKMTINCPLILQVTSVIDTSESVYSQYRSQVTDLSTDNSVFVDPSDAPEPQFFKNHRKEVLVVTLSDGETEIKGIVADAIDGLGLATLPGTKILIHPPIVSRRNCIRLKPGRCQVLGGCSESIMAANWPVLKVFCRILNVDAEAAMKKAETARQHLRNTVRPEEASKAMGESLRETMKRYKEKQQRQSSEVVIEEIQVPTEPKEIEKPRKRVRFEDFDFPAPQDIEMGYPDDFGGSTAVENEYFPVEQQESLPKSHLVPKLSQYKPSCTQMVVQHVEPEHLKLPRLLGPKPRKTKRVVEKDADGFVMPLMPSKRNHPTFDSDNVVLATPEPTTHTKSKSAASYGPLDQYLVKLQQSDERKDRPEEVKVKELLPSVSQFGPNPECRTSTQIEPETDDPQPMDVDDPPFSVETVLADKQNISRLHEPVELSSQKPNNNHVFAEKPKTIVPNFKPSSQVNETPSDVLSTSVVVVKASQTPPRPPKTTNARPITTIAVAPIQSSQSQKASNESVVDHFKRLKIVKIKTVLERLKFWLTSDIRIIQPIKCETNNELGIKRGYWFLRVTVSDDSVENVKMMVDPEVVTELLGFTVDYAKNIHAANDTESIERCKNKAFSLICIFNDRLDLVLEVQFSPTPNTIPIIKKVTNMAHVLGLD